MSRRLGIGLAVTVCLLIGLTVAPVGFGAGPTYPTTAITQSGMKETTINEFPGVLVNYTNGFSTQFSSFVYLDLVNQAGQTVYWTVGTCNFSAGEGAQCFVAFSSAPSGNYTADLFATNTSGVPVSTTSSLSVTI
jgi:hypothetical protein